MPDSTRPLASTDIEQLLRDSRVALSYPPTPDIAGRALSRIQPAVADRGLPPGLIATAPSLHPASLAPIRPIPFDAGKSSLPGQLVRLAAAILAFIVVGGLLVAVFGLTGGDDDDRQGAPASEAVIQDRLYTLSLTFGASSSTSHFTAHDAQTGEQAYAIDISYAANIVRSPDGEVFYLLTGTGVVAIQASDGSVTEMAAKPENASYYPFGGPSSLTISPDGRWLYVYRYYGEGDVGAFTYGVQVIDTQTGMIVRETEQWPDNWYADDHCTPQTHATLDNSRLYQFCWGTRRVKAIDLATGTLLDEMTVAGDDTIDGSIQTPDGRFVYVASTGPIIEVFDLSTGQTVATHNLAPGDPVEINRPLLALSDDGTRLAIGIKTVEQGDRIHDLGRVIVVDTDTWETVADLRVDPILPNSPKWPHAMAFSPDGATLYMVGRNPAPGMVSPYVSSLVVTIDIATGARSVALESPDDVERVFTGPTSGVPR